MGKNYGNFKWGFQMPLECLIHKCGFCSRAGEIYTQQKFKIVTPILIMGLIMGYNSRPIVRHSKKINKKPKF